MTTFLPDAAARPAWYHPEPAADEPQRIPSMPDPAYAAGCQLVRLVDSVVDVFARCEWCRRRTPGVLAPCADPDCPGSAS